jgi:hypothetical protein
MLFISPAQPGSARPAVVDRPNGQGLTGLAPSVRPWEIYFLPEGLVEGFLPNLFSNRATRPPVSRIFCLPV